MQQLLKLLKATLSEVISIHCEYLTVYFQMDDIGDMMSFQTIHSRKQFQQISHVNHFSTICIIHVSKLWKQPLENHMKWIWQKGPSGILAVFVACGALAASISVGIVIPSTWFVYLYKQTVSITVVVMGTKQFNDKTTHRQQLKTGFVQKWEMGKKKSRTFPGLFQDFFIFQGLNFFPIL